MIHLWIKQHASELHITPKETYTEIIVQHSLINAFVEGDEKRSVL